MKLLIVESPAKAKTINKFLGKDFKVISSYGHIRGLPSKEGAVNPENDFEMRYQLQSKSSKHVKEIVEQAKKCDELYLATDPDREGEAISWHILEALKEKKVLAKINTIRRVVFHEITKTAILNAIENYRDLDMNLVHAQQARQALDYLVGFTLSPVLWRKLPGSKSAGRVQSVALRVICERECEIEKFKAEEYWSIAADCVNDQKDKFAANLIKYDQKKLEKLSIQNEQQATDIVTQLKQEEFYVASVDKKQTTRRPYAPFTTSTLLQDASNKLGFSAKRTASIAQKLYEGISVGGNTVGLITYMRTDSTSINKDFQIQATDFIKNTYGNEFAPSSLRIFKTKTKNAQEAHEAIRPTHMDYPPEKIKNDLDADQYKLYSLIWKRFVASQMADAKINSVAVNINSQNDSHTFKANGSSIAFKGFLEVYQATKEDENILPDLNQGEQIAIDQLLPKQHFTQPPARYSEASLVKKMEELGIGRPSTYPAIISVLQEREYVKLEKKRFIAEIRGRVVNAFLSSFFAKYVEYDFTANLENELDEVSNSKLNYKKVLDDFWKPFKKQTDDILEHNTQEILAEVKNSLTVFISQFLESDKCPDCADGKLELKFSRFGAFIGCSNYPECKHTKKLGASAPADGGDANADSEYPKVLGEHPEFKREVTIRKGPYGIYVQLDGKAKKDIKRTGLPKNITPENVDLAYAISLLSLPRVLGEHPETNNEIKAGLGRYGPYVEHNKKFVSIKGQDPVTISLEDAIVAIDAKK